MFDYEQHYFLREAFERTGQAMYGGDWDGAEVFSKEPFDTRPIKDARAAVEAELSGIRRQLSALSFGIDEATAGERKEISLESGVLYARRDELRRKLNELPKAGEIPEKELAVYERRLDVERQLWAAFRQGDLTLWGNGTSQVDVARYETRAGFSISFEFSMIRVSAKMSSRRRSIASVKKHAFGSWLKSNFESRGFIVTTAEGACLLWMQDMALKKSIGSKSDYRDLALKKFDGLSSRAFDRVWDKTAPVSWKKSGPKPPR